MPKSTRFCAVVKANAYGMGDIKVSHAIADHVYMFAVARIAEAVRLRESGITKPILLFGICEDYKTAIAHNITVTCGSMKEMYAVAGASALGKLNVHIKVNTGMNRFGICTPWHLRNMLAYSQKFKNLNICGLYTHFSHEYTSQAGQVEVDKQLKRFAPYRAIMRRTCPHALVHAACSGTAHYRLAQFDMVRIGKAMYGGFEGYKTAVTIAAKIIAVQHLTKGQHVGYGGKFTATENMTAGIVSCGYAVAGFLLLGNKYEIYVDKKPCKILGAVCMDTMAIDISDIQNPQGKMAIISGDSAGSRITDFINQNGTSGATYLCTLGI
jgi:alanine racemase